MSVSGQYVKTFAEASHVVFDGCLDDEGFRDIAMQKLTAVHPNRITTEKGNLTIKRGKKSEYTYTWFHSTYHRLYLNSDKKTKAKGFPFKDLNTDAVGEETPLFEGAKDE